MITLKVLHMLYTFLGFIYIFLEGKLGAVISILRNPLPYID